MCTEKGAEARTPGLCRVGEALLSARGRPALVSALLRAAGRQAAAVQALQTQLLRRLSATPSQTFCDSGVNGNKPQPPPG